MNAMWIEMRKKIKKKSSDADLRGESVRNESVANEPISSQLTSHRSVAAVPAQFSFDCSNKRLSPRLFISFFFLLHFLLLLLLLLLLQSHYTYEKKTTAVRN